MTTPGHRWRKLPHLLVLVLVSAAAGYAFAITVAKSSAPKQTVYELPHGFMVSDPTFLPSALPGPTMTPGNRLELLENGDAVPLHRRGAMTPQMAPRRRKGARIHFSAAC